MTECRVSSENRNTCILSILSMKFLSFSIVGKCLTKQALCVFQICPDPPLADPPRGSFPIPTVISVQTFSFLLRPLVLITKRKRGPNKRYMSQSGPNPQPPHPHPPRVAIPVFFSSPPALPPHFNFQVYNTQFMCAESHAVIQVGHG